ncbi:MAG: NUDIX hydrolase [Atopobiaceae bacterium]|jgi:ADP-ribose pyrophosphatase|nr:NUDIX hydrolase [Atopobiaceae bacterium]
MSEIDDVRIEAEPIDVGEELDGAIGDMSEAVQAYTFDGDRSDAAGHHESGEPLRRGLVLGEEDPRDIDLHEIPRTEDTMWQGRIFDVNRLNVELPDGRMAQRDVVRHPGAVAIVALTDDGRICLVRQYRTALGRVTVEIPAGKLDPGEDPLECANRELLEETGMRAERMAFLTTIATGVGFCDELIHMYMATGLSFAASDPDADEFINVDLVPLDELIDAVLDGRIEDCKTVTGALICDAVAHRLQVEE